jgi:hypothetical protein
MITETIIFKVPEGTFSTLADCFENSDKPKIKLMIEKWYSLSSDLKSIGARGINIPEGISESLYCLTDCRNIVRITRSAKGTNSSCDCYNKLTYDRIQVKACSVLPDLSSFGPNSVFDKLIFMDLSNLYTGVFKIYDIPTQLIYQHKVNKTQTFLEQQQQVRRPRFSIFKSIIIPYKINPFLIGNINEW